MSTKRYFYHKAWKKGYQHGIHVRIEALTPAEIKAGTVKINNTFFDRHKAHLEGLGPHVVKEWASTLDVFFMNPEDAVQFKLRLT